MQMMPTKRDNIWNDPLDQRRIHSILQQKAAMGMGYMGMEPNVRGMGYGGVLIPMGGRRPRKPRKKAVARRKPGRPRKATKKKPVKRRKSGSKTSKKKRAPSEFNRLVKAYMAKYHTDLPTAAREVGRIQRGCRVSCRKSTNKKKLKLPKRKCNKNGVIKKPRLAKGTHFRQDRSCMRRPKMSGSGHYGIGYY